MDSSDFSLIDVLIWVMPLIIAITFHEIAHGWAALCFGDDTAKRARRLSINPLRHIDRFGTLLLPGLLYLVHSPFIFGYAKPVPVDFARLKPARCGMFMVALAGPATNIILAIISALLLHADQWVTPEQAPSFFRMLYLSIQINTVLAVLNLLPILPLDGGRMLVAIMPSAIARAFARLEPYGFFFLIALMLFPRVVEIDISEILIGKPAMWLTEQILLCTGNGSIT